MQTLRISRCSINGALCKKDQSTELDGRGKTGSYNQLTESKIYEVVQQISKFPWYVSHYCRLITKSEYLNADTTLPLMYKLYCQEHEKPVSHSLYNEMFYNKFNLKRKSLKKDTCNVCDSLKVQIKNSEQTEQAEEKHKSYLEMAE